MQRPSQSATRRGRRAHTIVTARQIAALASPIRQALVDAAAASGPASIAELATHLGRPASGLYHHVRALLAAGLLVEHEAPPAGPGRPAFHYDVPGRPMRIRYDPAQPATRAPMRKLVSAMTRAAAREFSAAYRPGVRVEGKARELWASRTEAWLTDAQVERANALLEELLRLFSGARRPRAARTRLRSLMWVLAPVNERPKDRKTERPKDR
jgi:predicted ArsR family transcriptional regulator